MHKVWGQGEGAPPEHERGPPCPCLQQRARVLWKFYCCCSAGSVLRTVQFPATWRRSAAVAWISDHTLRRKKQQDEGMQEP